MKGIFTATITPFDDDNNINESTLYEIMDRNIEEGVSGFFIGGSSGECFLLSFEERKKLLEICSVYRGRTKIIAHIGSVSTEEAIKLGAYAESLKYDAISSVAPYYFKMPIGNIAKYFIDIATNVDLPLIVYNFPNATGVQLDTNSQAIIKLLQHPSIMGVKHTNLDLYELERIRNINENLILYNGFDEIYLGGLAMGVDGAIGSTFNFMLPKFIKINEHFMNNEIEKARKVQNQANRIIDALVKVGLIPGIKFILETKGIKAGTPRKPLLPLTTEQKSYLTKVIQENS